MTVTQEHTNHQQPRADTLTGTGVVVTGGARGIGASIVDRLAADGATVVFSYLDADEAAGQVCDRVRAGGGTALAVRSDARDANDTHRLFETAEQVFAEHAATPRGCVLNAGVIHHSPLTDLAEADFRRVLDTNVLGAFFGLQQAARRIADGGRVIAISSTSTAWPSIGEGAYAATKGALEQLVRVASRELGRRGVTVNAISPGATDTDALREHAPEQARQAVAAMTALGRLGQPHDIADLVRLLLDPNAGWLTGQNLRADGGLV